MQKKIIDVLKLISIFSFILTSIALASSERDSQSSKAEYLVKSTIDSIRTTVIEGKKTLSEEELNIKLEEVIANAFNFNEMSSRCLGMYWRKANEEQKREFTKYLTILLSTSYLNKIRNGIEESKIEYDGSRSGEDSVVVKTKIEYKGEMASVDYRLMKAGNEDLKIYDVIIENIGLVSNYRSEFGSIVSTYGIDGLIEKLKNRVENKK